MPLRSTRVVTFSIGVASYARAPADFDALLAAADGLMYEAKKAETQSNPAAGVIDTLSGTPTISK